MNSNEINKNIIKANILGNLEVNIYNEEGVLKRTHKASNIITTQGIGRLADMLIDGYNQNYPLPTVFNNNEPTSTLKSLENFGKKPGEIFGINFIPWEAREKSTFTRTGWQDNFVGKDNMFDNDASSYTTWQATTSWNVQFPPDDNYGYCCDLGITDVTNENFNATIIDTWYDVDSKNLKWDAITVQSNDLLITYVKDTDYNFLPGDGDSFGQLKILNASLVGINLKIKYSWYDVPQVPIVGFAFETRGNYGHRSFWNAWKWSLDQGKTRADSFFPNVQGVPHKPGWETRYWDRPWYPTWHGDNNNNWAYFHNSLPWAVKNPTQLSWYGNQQDSDKYVYDFQLLGYKMPKLGAHAIGLGTGTGTVNASDTNLFNFEIKRITHRKSKNGTTGLQIKTYLDFNEGNGKTFTEGGLYYPTNDSVYFKKDENYSISRDDGGNGGQTATGSNGIYRLSPLVDDDFDALMSHAMFDTPWSKNESERAEIVYNLSMVWS